MSVTRPVPVNIITGMLGAGKTTTIQYLLQHRPEHERWAVLVNEFGNIGIDGALLEGQGIEVREVPGGCICCTAALTLKTTLTEMLRRIPMDRLLIEPTGIGHPAGVVDTLQDEWLREAVRLEHIITVVEPGGFSRERLKKSASYKDQLQLADVVLINKADTADEASLKRLEAWMAGLYPPKLAVLRSEYGALDPAWLAGEGQMPAGAQGHHHHEESCSLEREGPAGSSFSSREEGGLRTLGWRFPPEIAFDRRRAEERLRAWMEGHPSIRRLKAVLNTGKTTYAVNALPSGFEMTAVAWRRDSRIELIVALNHGFDEAQIESELEGILKTS